VLKKIKSEVLGSRCVVRKLWRGKIVCFEVTSEIGFYSAYSEERLTGGTQRTTGLMVRYEVVEVSRLLSR